MLDDFNSELLQGLTEEEAKLRLDQEGFNELPTGKRKSYLDLFINVLKEPMFILLVIAGAVYALLGEKEEGLMLLGFVFFIILITFYQENKTEHALEALRDLSSPRALVIRNGQQLRIAGKEVVRGDIILLAEGDRVPADAILLSSNNLQIDESLLTGESVPVRKVKVEKSFEMLPPGGDDIPCVYSGTLVVNGTGIAVVKAIGINTEMGKIGKTLQKVEEEKTQLQKETTSIVKNFAFVGISISFIVIIVYSLTKGDWLAGILTGVALAMAILPEEFPVVLTIFLALGAWRLSKKNVLTRKQYAIQALGSATVLCVDKTGTITMNKMSVRQLRVKTNIWEENNVEIITTEYYELLKFGYLASQINPFDPMEKAIKKIAIKSFSGLKDLYSDMNLINQYSLTKETLAMTNVWKTNNETNYIIAMKGAPETVCNLCHLPYDKTETVLENVEQMAKTGLRVLGVAKASYNIKDLPEKQQAFNFTFIGLLGFEDPVRPRVKDAINECYTAGIRVVMITGDYPETAKSIGSQIGLKNSDKIMTGKELNRIDNNELQNRIPDINIFARVIPEQKLSIVNALKTHHEIVAMTGDGVNDAPALKSAHIGVAMGERGTDVARESSSIVLLDDNFATIVDGVKMGRRIFDNIRKAMAYILAVHIPIAGLTLLAVLLNWPLILLPVHIVFLELIIDPACSIVFESQREEPDIMKRPPRDPDEAIFNKQTVFISIFQGIAVLIIVAAIYQTSLILLSNTEAESRALAFTTLILANLSLIVTNVSWSKVSIANLVSGNRALWYLSALTLIFLGAILFIPFLQDLFKFGALHYYDFIIAISGGFLIVFMFDIWKMYLNSKNNIPSL